MEKFMTMKEVGAYLRLSTQTVKRLIQRGRLTAHRIGPCSYRIPEDAVQALLTQTLAGALVDSFEAAVKDQNTEDAR